jgi:S-adenosylmethionine hydrolase
LSATYSDVAPGLALALFGSYNLMEVAVRDGNASLTLGIGRGDRIRIGSGGGAA